jgi:cysteine desulfurase
LPLEEVKAVIKEKGSPALLHIDCVQAFGKINVTPYDLGADLISISAHKIHGPKGTGALFVKKGVTLPSFILGGGQERGLRSGTEAVPSIAAFGGAVKALPPLKQTKEAMSELKNYCIDRLKNFENVIINSPEKGLPFILNFSFLGYRSETLLHHLEKYGVCVSSGSACSKGKGSYVLREMGLSDQRVDSALRISFSRENKKEDIDALISGLETALSLKKSQK